MSRVDELLTKSCPEGVAFIEIGDLVERVSKVRWTDAGDETFRYIDLSSVDRDLHRVSETALIDQSTAPSRAQQIVREGDVLFGTTRPLLKRYCTITKEFDGQIASTGFCVLRPKREKLLSNFLFHMISTADFYTFVEANERGASYPAISDRVVKKFRIPVPPLDVQQEIVNILDTFSDLEAELEAELEARIQQYEHYREKLLANASANAEVIELRQLGRIVTGRTPKASDSSAWGSTLDFITPSDIKNGMKEISKPSRRLSDSGAGALTRAVIPAKSILVTCIGADMGKTVINANSCVTNQQINSIVLEPGNDIDFIFHSLTAMRNQIRSLGERAGGTMPIINKTDFSKIKIALPSLNEQRRIAEILNKFNALVHDLSIGLPAELTARRQQYEYYRDKLLTFQELEATS